MQLLRANKLLLIVTDQGATRQSSLLTYNNFDVQ